MLKEINKRGIFIKKVEKLWNKICEKGKKKFKEKKSN